MADEIDECLTQLEALLRAFHFQSSSMNPLLHALLVLQGFPATGSLLDQGLAWGIQAASLVVVVLVGVQYGNNLQHSGSKSQVPLARSDAIGEMVVTGTFLFVNAITVLFYRPYMKAYEAVHRREWRSPVDWLLILFVVGGNAACISTFVTSRLWGHLGPLGLAYHVLLLNLSIQLDVVFIRHARGIADLVRGLNWKVQELADRKAILHQDIKDLVEEYDGIEDLAHRTNGIFWAGRLLATLTDLVLITYGVYSAVSPSTCFSRALMLSFVCIGIVREYAVHSIGQEVINEVRSLSGLY